MPTVVPTTTPRILVTGANGYIAMWVIRTLLEQGYAVRGAVRSEAKGKRLREYFGDYAHRVEWVVVEDITKEGAFDEAVKNVDAIEHTASPVTTTVDDPDEYIIPAVNGTLGILKSALKFGANLKRVVITSSCSAIARDIIPAPDKPTHVFTEKDWADESVAIVKRDGRKAPNMAKYRTSKCLAERAAWNFVEEHKAEIGWDLATLLPPYVLGPPLQEVTTPSSLNASLAKLYDVLFHEQSDDSLQASFGYVDVRDIALSHVKVLQIPEAAGERFIISAGGATWQEMRDLANTIVPSLYTSGILPRGNPTLERKLSVSYDGAKSRKILGMEYGSLARILADTLADFEARGWTEAKTV